MTITEKLLIGIILFLGLTVKILGLFEIGGGALLLLTTYASLIVLIIYYMTRMKLSIYSAIFGLMIIETLGVIFRIQHWPGQEIFGIIGPLWALIFSGVLLWTIFNDGIGKESIYFYVISGSLLTQVILLAIGNHELIYYGLFLEYLIVAAIGTMKLTDQKIEMGIDKILNIILIQGILLVISQTINLIK